MPHLSFLVLHLSLLVAPVPGLQCTPRARPVQLCADAFFSRSLSSLPDEPETCLLQMRAAIKAAIDSGHQKLVVDIEVPQLDASSRGFDANLLARFAVAAAQCCAASVDDAAAEGVPTFVLRWRRKQVD